MKCFLLKLFSSIAVRDTCYPYGLLTSQKLPCGKFRDQGDVNTGKEKFFKTLMYFLEDSLICLKSVRSKLFRRCIFGKKPMDIRMDCHDGPTVDITVLTAQHEKSSITDSFGPQSSTKHAHEIARIVKALVFSVLSIRSLELQILSFILGIPISNAND
ncbi:hypothetical protein Tco_0252048 [Tanacetum coccineum]